MLPAIRYVFRGCLYISLLLIGLNLHYLLNYEQEYKSVKRRAEGETFLLIFLPASSLIILSRGA